jgi:hypothetical protein
MNVAKKAHLLVIEIISAQKCKNKNLGLKRNLWKSFFSVISILHHN